MHDMSLTEDAHNNILKRDHVEIDYENLLSDLRLRCSIRNYNPNDMVCVRQSYLQKGHRQPFHHDFTQTVMMNEVRKSNKDWFEQYANWLEYGITKDSVYCRYSYLFKPKMNQGGGDVFVNIGFRNWKKEKLWSH